MYNPWLLVSKFLEKSGQVNYNSIDLETISNYQRLGLIDEDVDRFDEQTNINALMSIGLYKIVFLPYAYILDRWRWDLYEGKVKPEDANCHWHKLRQDFQGKRILAANTPEKLNL